MKNTVAFVILHYKDDTLTSNCIDSLLKLYVPSDTIIHCVVIDNGSGNNSAERLMEQYEEIEGLHFIVSKQNLGFSRANNKAFEFACDELAAQWAIVINNDTVFEQKDFIKQMFKSYVRNNEPQILAPDIYAPNRGVHQSPMAEKPITVEMAKESLRNTLALEGLGPATAKEAIVRLLEKTTIGWRWLSSRREQAYQKRKTQVRWNEVQENCVPLGAALIFTPGFIETNELPFDPPTFLFCEEEILAHRCQHKGWRIVYDPAMRVIHLASGSIGKIDNNANKALSFRRRNMIEAYRVLIDYIRNE